MSLADIIKIDASVRTPCKKCGVLYVGDLGKDFICLKCKEELEWEQKALKQKAEQVQNLLKNSGIPKRYANAPFAPKTDKQKEVAEFLVNNFKANLSKARDVLLFGSIGSGKTHIVTAFLREFIKAFAIKAKYATEWYIFELYTAKEFAKLEELKNTQLLCIDELGKRELVEWQRVQLEELISYRYNEMLPTIFITNLTDMQFKQFVGDRLADRLRDNNIKRFAFTDASLRGAKNA